MSTEQSLLLSHTLLLTLCVLGSPHGWHFRPALSTQQAQQKRLGEAKQRKAPFCAAAKGP